MPAIQRLLAIQNGITRARRDVEPTPEARFPAVLKRQRYKGFYLIRQRVNLSRQQVLNPLLLSGLWLRTDLILLCLRGNLFQR
jgi:hypothetical protein